MRIALDTNVLLYAEGIDNAARRDTARTTLLQLDSHDVFIPAQVLGEMFRVLTRKMRWSAARAQAVVLDLCDLYNTIDTTQATVAGAMALHGKHQFGIWDALILDAAAQVGCDLLLSEDLHDGFVWRGVTVANPFKSDLHPLLASALAD